LKKKFFSPLPKGDSSLLGSKKTTFGCGYGFGDLKFVFLDELGTCP
jgi:hypothetical protein